jgi:hypothetical protein
MRSWLPGQPAVFGQHVYSARIPSAISIFSAEANAILLALKFVASSEKIKFMICSDSFFPFHYKRFNICIRNRTIGYRIIQCVLGFPVNDRVPMNTYMTRDPCVAEIRSITSEYSAIYTDGSKDGDRVASAAVFGQ